MLPPGGGVLPPGGCAWWRPPGTANAAGGRHPTGMHSYSYCVSFIYCVLLVTVWICMFVVGNFPFTSCNCRPFVLVSYSGVGRRRVIAHCVTVGPPGPGMIGEPKDPPGPGIIGEPQEPPGPRNGGGTRGPIWAGNDGGVKETIRTGNDGEPKDPLGL